VASRNREARRDRLGDGELAAALSFDASASAHVQSMMMIVPSTAHHRPFRLRYTITEPARSRRRSAPVYPMYAA